GSNPTTWGARVECEAIDEGNFRSLDWEIGLAGAGNEETVEIAALGSGADHHAAASGIRKLESDGMAIACTASQNPEIPVAARAGEIDTLIDLPDLSINQREIAASAERVATPLRGIAATVVAAQIMHLRRDHTEVGAGVEPEPLNAIVTRVRLQRILDVVYV